MISVRRLVPRTQPRSGGNARMPGTGRRGHFG